MFRSLTMNIYDAGRPIYFLCKISGLAMYSLQIEKYATKKIDIIFSVLVAIISFSTFVLLWKRNDFSYIDTEKISEHIFRAIATIEMIVLFFYSFFYKNSIINCYDEIYNADLKLAETGLEIAHSQAKKELTRNLIFLYSIMACFIFVDLWQIVFWDYPPIICVAYDLGGLIATNHLCFLAFLLNEFGRRFSTINAFLKTAQKRDFGTVLKLLAIYKGLYRHSGALNAIFEEQMLYKIFSACVVCQTTFFLTSKDASLWRPFVNLDDFWLLLFALMHIFEVMGAVYYFHVLQTEVSA